MKNQIKKIGTNNALNLIYQNKELVTEVIQVGKEISGMVRTNFEVKNTIALNDSRTKNACDKADKYIEGYSAMQPEGEMKNKYINSYLDNLKP